MTTATRERPILFSGPMMRAIQDGTKTQTRRVMKRQPPSDISAYHQDGGGNWIGWTGPDSPGLARFTKRAYPSGEGIACPYGQPGDRLWVKEGLRSSASGMVVYASDHIPAMRDGASVQWGWKRAYLAGRFMPRWASRLTLEALSVRVERVQDISHKDMVAEGTEDDEWLEYEDWVCQVMVDGGVRVTLRDHFAELWDSINAKRGFGWNANPWVFVISFKRIAR